MSAITVRSTSGILVAFGPDNGMYDPGIPDGCTKAIEPDYEAVIAEWQAQQAPTQYQQLRAAAYPPMADYLDGIVKNDTAQIEAYRSACLAVKQAYPK